FLFEVESLQKKTMFSRWLFVCDLLLSFQCPAKAGIFLILILILIRHKYTNKLLIILGVTARVALSASSPRS
ncbi:MAG: hypothetical protein ACM31G_10100, partial [Flavobacteriales bacterium]